jgi:hypothetical protein
MAPFFGPPNVRKMSANGDIAGLTKALRHEDSAVRRDAAAAIGLIADERSVLPLVDALTDEAFDVRESAARSLIQLDVDWSGVVAAPTVVPKLVAIMGNALRMPHQMGTVKDYDDKSSVIAARRAATITLGKIMNHGATDALVKALRDNPDSNVRCEAAEALGKIDHTNTMGTLLSALVDADLFVRKAAGRALLRRDSNWPASDAAKSAVPLFTATLEKCARISHEALSWQEVRETYESYTDIPDLERPAFEARERLKVRRAEALLENKALLEATQEVLELIARSNPPSD